MSKGAMPAGVRLSVSDQGELGFQFENTHINL